MLCSQGFTLSPLDTTVIPPAPTTPECNTGTSGSTIALEGTVSRGTAEWDETGTYATFPVGSVYAGVAKVNAHFTVKPGGTVYGESVNGGSGKFKGTLDHRPLLSVPRQPPILEGTLELKQEF
jgi:hypothetical protein